MAKLIPFRHKYSPIDPTFLDQTSVKYSNDIILILTLASLTCSGGKVRIKTIYDGQYCFQCDFTSHISSKMGSAYITHNLNLLAGTQMAHHIIHHKLIITKMFLICQAWFFTWQIWQRFDVKELNLKVFHNLQIMKN